MTKFASLLTSHFPHQPTAGQHQLFGLLDDFIREEQQQVFILRGYAGTGKTSVISALTKSLPSVAYRSVLMAPTGRASKVMANYAKRRAFTIHRLIYKQSVDEMTGSLYFELQKNNAKRTLFIVDEASMLNDDTGYQKGGLLQDLLQFVFADRSNRLLLVGDVAQLPPVGHSQSPALEHHHLESRYGFQVRQFELNEVVRQAEGSGILSNATMLRSMIQQNHGAGFRFQITGFEDIYRMTGQRLEDGLRYAYDKFGVEGTAIITRSNKSAVQYNQYIRRQIHFREEAIEAGDYLMIVKNNYSILPDDAPAGFLANGDFVEVMKVVNTEERYGLRFASLELRLLDVDGQLPFEAMVCLDTLTAETPAMPEDQFRQLQDQVQNDYFEEGLTKVKFKEALRKDPYLNALQIKFAYALTCHKSQGGQWPAVFVDQGYLREDQVNQEWMRWLYTAMTRAREELFMMNFNDKFF
ncbi:ATP-dependent DNA helicase [Persicobacter psychrovividus]|uniref:ATP-dependent exodeoxyribonuclease n=1 Tax=Persicobacter psychrovividus TaxID=387638 RepID=A0ABM7VDR4_9BACT|nr:ATP-dependent exodeoxyribonuclease [Persicobacter psychrovividus]